MDITTAEKVPSSIPRSPAAVRPEADVRADETVLAARNHQMRTESRSSFWPSAPRESTPVCRRSLRRLGVPRDPRRPSDRRRKGRRACS
jgi:hypothetical protein